MSELTFIWIIVVISLVFSIFSVVLSIATRKQSKEAEKAFRRALEDLDIDGGQL